jgi:voltage-gated potassium channel
MVLADELALRWEVRRMQRQIKQLRDHHIVAGFGRVGRETALALRALGQPVVVIDEDTAALTDAADAGFPAIQGNATEDATLSRAGIERAAGLVAVFGSDAENVFVTLSARALNPTVPIVARANEASAVPKLTRAGANQVVFPYDKTGRHMARLVLRPDTVDFVENLFKCATGDLLVEGIRVDPGSPLAGVTIQEARARAPHSLFLAIHRDGATISPPPPDLRLAGNDLIAAVGTEADLRLLEGNSQRFTSAGSSARSGDPRP